MLLANPEAAAWIESLRASTLDECAMQKRQVEKAWREPLTTRIASGRALGMLRIVRRKGPLIVLELTSPETHPCFLREGDFVRLSRNDPFLPAAQLVLTGEDDEGLHAFIWKGGPSGAPDEWTIDSDHIDLTDRYLDALDALALSPRLLDSLMGKSEPGIDHDLDGACRDELAGGPFNRSQIDAVAACVAARDAFLVQGPPGTGKTRVLAEVVSRLIDRGESVLVTGPTHRAIDHALSAIRHVIGTRARVVKIGFTATGSRGDFEKFEHYDDSGLAGSTDPHVVGATPFALWSGKSGLYPVRFDSVLIDEASQVVPLVAAMAMLRGERWLFFGDDRQLPPVMLTSDGTPLPPGFPLRRLVVFPNVEQSTIDQIELLRGADCDTGFLGMKQSGDADFARRLEALAAAPLAEPELHALRKEFTPESVIHESCRPLPLARRTGETTIMSGFLDFSQESLVKLDLELSPEAERAAQESQARLVTGPAGCGKSLVLLHRAVQAAKLHRDSRLLVLTHNRPINGELRRRFEAMMPGCRKIEWLTFFGWASRYFNGPQAIIPTRVTERRLEALAPTVPGLEKLTAVFLAEEIHYLRDLGIRTEADYLGLDRSGRAAGLTRERRLAVWRLLERYRDELRGRGELDWHERALDFELLARQRPWALKPGYDFIFIDEAQFFAKCWFAPVVAALRPGGQLFLSADPTQGFLKRRLSWLAAGIDVRGRSTRLSRPYRTTRRILAFATRLYQLHHPDPTVQDETDLADAVNLSKIEEEGEWPEIVAVATPRQEIDAAVERVVHLRDHAPELAGRILLLHADSFAAGDLVKALERRLGSGQARDLGDRTPPESPAFCSVSNLNAATGLEAAIVLVLGLDRLVEKEGDPRLEVTQLADLRADHAKLLYVAATRAARRLVVFCHSEGFTRLLHRATDESAPVAGEPS